MKLKRKNHSIFLRGLVFAVAFALAVICMPTNALAALAVVSLDPGTKVDYNYITLSLNDAKTTVTKGENYTVPTAYIGGNNKLPIGSADVNDTELEHPTDETKVKILSTKVSVGYGSAENAVAEKEFESGTLHVNKVGTYVITYSYEYEVQTEGPGEKPKYTNKFEFKIESTLSNATIDFKNNTPAFIPSIIDLNVGDPTDVLLPIPEITGEDGEVYNEENGKKITVSTSSKPVAGTEGYVLYITAVDSKATPVDITEVNAENNEYKIAKEVFTSPTSASGKYTIKYAFYDNGYFVTSTTKEIEVYAKGDGKGYYENYTKPAIQVSNFPTSAQTGVEISLPAASGLTSSTTTPANEAVDVYYQVKVRYMSSSSDRSYRDIKDIEVDGVKIYQDVVDAEGYLKDATKFTPLQDGWYTFNYKVTDIYGNSYEAPDGKYSISNIKDETAPTPVIYDASVVDAEQKPTYEDATYKLKTNANPYSVVVYAIGIDDNVSTIDDNNKEENGIVLNRRIATSLTDLFTIEGYDAYNLIFNFTGENKTTTFDKAWEALLKYNYMIKKDVDKYNAAHPEETLDDQEAQLKWLKDNNYRIVIDNGNLETMISMFGESALKDAKPAEADLTAEDLKTWLQSKTEAELTELGFAYVDYDKTFGATTDSNSKAQGVGQFYVHYVAIDKSGNDRDISRPMYITGTVDSSSPTIKFSTQLSASYLPEATITFDAPSASDTSDSNMFKRVLYRYVDDKGALVPFETIEESAPKQEGYVDLDELYADLGDNVTDGKGNKLKELYKEYHDYDASDDTKKFDGYKEITDTSKTSYSIDLKDAPKDAKGIQIVAFTYDDAGNPSMTAMQTKIFRTTDEQAPIFVSVESNMTDDTIYQGAEVKLPTLKVADDAVGYMTYEIKATRVDGENEYTIDVADSYAERNANSTGAGSYTIHGGKFTASAAGTYKVAITARDSANNAITYFTQFEVKGRILIQQPQISATLTSGTYQLNDNPRIELPTPTVYYQIPNSITYTEFKNSEIGDKQYVVIGVEADGTASQMGWTTNYGTAGLFEPKQVGIYDLQYTVKVRVYDAKIFEYNESEFSGTSYTEKDYFTLQTPNGLTGQFYAEKEGELKYVQGETAYILKLEDVEGVEQVVAYDEDGRKATLPAVSSMTKEMFEGLKAYIRQSDVYRIEVVDTVNPVISHPEYEDALTKEQFAANLEENEGFIVYGLEASEEINWSSDYTGIDFEWAPVKNSNNVAGFTEKLSGKTTEKIDKARFGDDASKTNGTIKITYKVEDMAGNKDSWTKTITVGDNENPRIEVKSGFVKESRAYTLDEPLEINKSKLSVTDNFDMVEGFDPVNDVVITVKDSSGNEITDFTEDGNIRTYNIQEVGTYTIYLEVTDAVGNKGTRSLTVTFSARAQDRVMTYQVVGTILIVVSVVVLAGVIIYFIVSKVKLDKELKKK